jgi:hypothetical protein
MGMRYWCNLLTPGEHSGGRESVNPYNVCDLYTPNEWMWGRRDGAMYAAQGEEAK